MSIWSSESLAGENEDDQHDGSVVSYINGWSNHYPGDFPPLVEEPRYQRRSPCNDLMDETPASIGTGWIPPWCVPGRREEAEENGLDETTHVGPWLRLDVIMRTVSIWSGVEVGNLDVHSVCLNEESVRALRDNLSEWLEREKVHPK